MARSLEAVSVDKLEGFLVCSICLEMLQDPRTLPCFHSYCKSCLARFVKNHRDKAVGRQVKEFNCPCCRSQFTLNPGEEVADMTTNYFICSMLEVMTVQNRLKVLPCSHCQGPSVGRCVTCEVFLCRECLTDHNKYRAFKDHSVLTMDELSKPENQGTIRGRLYCKEHDTKVLKFYCETCSELICRYCMDFNHTKANHSCLPVDNVADKEKIMLASQCNTLEVKLKRGKKAFKEISDVKQSLERVKEQVRRDINRRKDAVLNAVTQQLNGEVERLMGQVDEIYSDKHNTLAEQQEEVKGYVDKLESCVNLSTGLLEKGTNEEILSSTKMIKENMEKVQTETPKNLKPGCDDKIDYKCGPLKIRIHDQMGRVEDLKDGRKPMREFYRSQKCFAFQQMNLDEECSSTHIAQFILQVYKMDLELFKSQHGVDVVFSQDQKRLILKTMRGFDTSQKNELESKFQQFYESMSKKLKEVTIDLREFTAEDIEKIKKSMSSQRKQFDVMVEESNRDVYTLVGDADNVEMFRKNIIGALRKNSPVSKETLPAEPMVASRKGVRVILMQGDIEKQQCDAIVNFTDKDLEHKTGIPCAIKERAGMTFWSECRDIIAKNGSLLSNMVTMTTSGLLPCQQVIHVILPDFSKERSQEVLCHGLQEACRLALNKAKENQMKSISFPVVTPNIVNQVVSSHPLFHAIIEFIKENSPLNDNTIEEIRIIYRKNSPLVEECVNEFSKYF